MNHDTFPTRLVPVILAALLALPLAQLASPAEAKQRSRTVTRTFRNPAPIGLPIGTVTGKVAAALYPSAIEVGGLKKGRIRDVDVRLVGLDHTDPNDVEMVLVGPGGQTAVVMAEVADESDADNVTLRLDDEAASPLPEGAPLQSGTFRPTNGGGETNFIPPAPSPRTDAALSVFDGTDPNGTWRLFVQDDDALINAGAFAGGWTLELKVRVKAKKKGRS